MTHRAGLGLCGRCDDRWRDAPPQMEFEDFCEIEAPRIRQRGGQLCQVCRTPGHERPARSHGLCTCCRSSMLDRGQTVDAYLSGDGRFPPATPRPTFGVCEVIACQRWAHRFEPALCEPHERNWIARGRPTGVAWKAWCAQGRALDVESRVVVLRGLSELLQLELLYGLQSAARGERRTTVKATQGVVGLLRVEGAASVLDVLPAPASITRESGRFLRFMADRLVLAFASPETEAAKDDWDLRVFGRAGGWLHFGRISQTWLRESAKLWAAERLGTIESPGTVDRLLQSVGVFSESLRRHRRDRGNDPAALSRADVTAFVNDLAHQENAGRMSRYVRTLTLAGVDQFLREARGMGVTRSGQPAAGLGNDVTLHPTDRIRRPWVAESGRALPQVVVDQLLAEDALGLLEAAWGSDVRTMLELQVLVGRRSGELCGLRWDCLSADEVVDENGRMRPAPVLVHDMPKVAIRRYHLPIDDEAAGIIRAQQARVRDRFPETPTSQLALFPALHHNVRGVKPRSQVSFCHCLRSWVGSLAELLGPDGADYDRSTITPYSFRHTYAQRHADAGTPVEVLAALMGHRKLTTTQGYYRVGKKRKRAAVDLLAALQVDRAGDRTRPLVERLLDAEHLRDVVGQVAVPFGVCREPTNVKAHGQACPFRHQCFGCTHFRSDPSFLPELRVHLGRLLADKERLRAAVPELEEWARRGVIPSGEEVAAVRRVVDRCEGLLGDLSSSERAAIDEAIGIVRSARAQLDTSVPVRFLGAVGQSSPTLFPNVQRHHEADDDD